MVSKFRYLIYCKFKLYVAYRKEQFANWLVVGGSDCQIFPVVEFGSKSYLVTIREQFRIANRVPFIAYDCEMWALRELGLMNAVLFKKIRVGNDVFGRNIINMPNVNIGSNVVNGTSSVETKDLVDNSIVAGVPARVCESIEKYVKKAVNKCDYIKDLNSEERLSFVKIQINIFYKVTRRRERK